MFLRKSLFLAIALLALGVAAKAFTATHGATTKSDRNDPVATKVGLPKDGDQNGVWLAAYTAFVKNEVKDPAFSTLLNANPSLVEKVCPNYAKLSQNDRAAFWATFVMALSFAETDFNRHAGSSVGITQVKCDSTGQQSYGCKCRSNSDLVQNNYVAIDCGMKVLQYWVARNTLLDRSPYFGTLRNSKSFPGFHGQSEKVIPTILTYAPKACGTRAPTLGKGMAIPGSSPDGSFRPRKDK